MSTLKLFSFKRFMAITGKEFIQMRRDRLTFAMMIGIPIIQLILFGYAINSDPRHLPLAILSGDNSQYSRAIVSDMQTSTYFDVDRFISSRAEANKLLELGEVQFVLTIPEQFGQKIERGERPTLLLEADATDPMATGNAVNSMKEIVNRAMEQELKGSLSYLLPKDPPVNMLIHADYNPEAISQYNIVPGLMGVILTMTLSMITSLAITRERERGTMENLLTTPVRPLEVMLGKIIPYVLVGYIQVMLIMLASIFLFNVPINGNPVIIFLYSSFFIAANLTVGVTISTIAKNQLQAVQMSIFFFLPSLLLSGFMFPFRGMPQWAQTLGSFLPLTHYLRLVRGVLLKGSGWMESTHHLWPIIIFWLVILAVGLKRYKKTLD
ncbi:ABC transporter permease [Desulfovibrio gilichinskyi]|uniref:ABC-2 type transport system permease protein n=1 Tax=Desulfovibrio gilichinskyi TaxID=1519643 RepID=A0A1X7C1Q7_9BACT|nr:ABC transporter permease [Desulfovibrio gilichinskyi]SME88386.1 ABC-2 type transport system permease protein [Desulfovibrio gilichinskyi]